jgi:hypothetical protein
MTAAVPWRGLVNAILYVEQFSPVLDDAAVEELADQLVTETFLDLTPEREYALLTEALRSHERFTELIDEPHSEEAIRDFVRRVVERMDRLRPWPERG